MPKKFEFATGGSGEGAEGKKINVVYPPEVQRKLDDALGVVEKAGSPVERAAGLRAYKQLVDVVGAEQQERMKLVDFRGEQIHNFELQALKKIVEQINEDYAEQRKVDPGFEEEDIVIDEIKIKIEDDNIVEIVLSYKKLKKIPESIGTLTNLRWLALGNNQITEISGLEGLTNLQKLELDSNKITEISGLESLTNLQELGLRHNQIIEIRGLEGLTSLECLWLNNNQITKIGGLEELANLRQLGLSANWITEISGLRSLINLQTLSIYNNPFDINALTNQAELEKLKKSGIKVIV